MKIVDELKGRLIDNIYTQNKLDNIMEGFKYYPLEADESEEDGFYKYTNYRSEIWLKYAFKDTEECIISDVTYKVKKRGKTQVHAFKEPYQIKAMMDYFRNNGQDDWFLVFVLGITLGRRIGDTLSLKWSDFYYENGNKKTILNTVVEQKTGKTIEIKISNSTWNYIEGYKQAKRINLTECLNVDIFDTEEKAELREEFFNNRITKEEYDVEYPKIVKKQAALYRYAFKKAADFNGIEGVSTHSTRKTFGYFAHKLNPYDPDNLDVLQTILGHSDRETTKVYIDIMSEKAEKIFDGIGKFVSDVDNNKGITIEKSPVIALKTEDFRNIINLAYRKGKQAEGDILDAMNEILKEAEQRRVS